MDEIVTSNDAGTTQSVEAMMASEMVARGHWTQEHADSMLAAAPVEDKGLDPLTPAAQKPVAAEGVDELTAAAFEGPATPAAYNFGALPEKAQTDPQQEIAFRQLFHAEGVPPAIGNEVGRLWNQAATAPPTEQQLEAGRQQCEQMLLRQWGPAYEANLAIVRAEVQRMAQKNPAIPDMLKYSGLGNNAWLANALLNTARAKGRAK